LWRLKGRRAEIIKLPLDREEGIESLLMASESSLDFGTPIDDEI